MADSPKKLSIPIETPANLTGLKETARELKNVEEAAKKGGKTNEETGKKSEFLGLKFGELKKLTRELGREFPIAGYAARLFLNPVAAAFTIAIAIFAKAKEAIDEMNKSLDEAAERAADPTFKEGIEARKSALEEGARKAEEFNRRMERAVDVETEYLEAVRNNIEATHAMAEADQKLADAQQGIDTEILKRKLQDGLISQAQYYQQLLEIEKNYEAEKLAREKTAHQAELKQLAAAQAEIASHVQPDKEAADKAIGDAAVKKAKLDKDKEDLKKLESEQADAEKRLKAADDTLTRFGVTDDTRRKAEENPNSPLAVAYAPQIKAYEDALRDRDQRLAAIKKLKDSLPGQTADVAVSESDASIAVGVAEKEKADARELEKERKRKAIQFGIDEDTHAAESTGKLDLDKLKMPIGGSGYTGADIPLAAQLEQQKALFAKHTAGVSDLSAKQKEFLDAFEKYFGVTHTNTDKQLQNLYKLIGSQTSAVTKQEAFDAELAELLKRQAKLESRSNTPPPR